jgi:hypothetical protein
VQDVLFDYLPSHVCGMMHDINVCGMMHDGFVAPVQYSAVLYCTRYCTVDCSSEIEGDEHCVLGLQSSPRECVSHFGVPTLLDCTYIMHILTFCSGKLTVPYSPYVPAVISPVTRTVFSLTAFNNKIDHFSAPFTRPDSTLACQCFKLDNTGIPQALLETWRIAF